MLQKESMTCRQLLPTVKTTVTERKSVMQTIVRQLRQLLQKESLTHRQLLKTVQTTVTDIKSDMQTFVTDSYDNCYRLKVEQDITRRHLEGATETIRQEHNC